MLEDDALRFDAFLKENDERVQDAIHKAENEAKNKQEKVTVMLLLAQTANSAYVSSNLLSCTPSRTLGTPTMAT